MTQTALFEPDDDEAARRAVRTQLDATLFVEAGAGSGKTSALVARIVELVATGTATMSQIAAITFTEAAAAELRDRVRESLERVAAGDIDDLLDPEHARRTAGERAQRAQRARDAVDEIDGAALSTLHAFAQRLLREHPLEAGLPPAVEVLDAMRSTVEREERWQQAVAELLEDPRTRGALTRLVTIRLDLDRLRVVDDAFSDNWDLLDDPAVAEALARDDEPLRSVRVEEVQRALDAALDARGTCTDGEDRLLEHLDQLEPFSRSLARAAAAPESPARPLELLELLANAPKLACRRGRKDNWNGSVEEVRGLLDDAEQARQRTLADAGGDALGRVLGGLRRQALDAAGQRRRSGRLEFHDLLVVARDLLRKHPSVVESLRRRYTHLLIDEFQDTDPIQAELAVRIASGGGDAPDPGRLFFVGDPKQAIYRFRRADLALFQAVRDEVVGGATHLTRNFRSTPGLIDWVNAVFEPLFGDGVEQGQPVYTRLVAHRPAQGGPVPVVALGGPRDGRAGEVRAEEGAELCATIRRVLSGDGWQIGDGEQQRPARLADIAVLMPTRTSLPALQRSLEDHEIPYRVEAASLVYQTREVHELLTTLRAVDDPTDEVATVAALRSALFGCGDDDLLRWYDQGGRWDYTRPLPDGVPADDPVRLAMAELAELHSQRWWHDAGTLIETVLRRQRVLELSLDSARPRDTWRRLRFVADQARAFADTAGGDLRRWLAWTDLMRAEGTRVPDAVLPETDDDAVRILTVHAAKGLEFPIVILTGLNTAPRAGRDEVLWGSDGPEARVGRVVTAGYEKLKEHDLDQDRFEQLRLLYVAATRARDHLVVCLHHRAGSKCAAAIVLAAQEEHPHLWRTQDDLAEAVGADLGGVADDLAREPDRRGDESGDESGDGGPAARAAWLAEREARLQAARRPRVVSPSGLADVLSESADGLEGPCAAALTDETTAPRGRGGTAFGSAVHAVLQDADLASGDDIEALAVAHADAEGIAERADEVARRARAALEAPSVRLAGGGARHWREIYLGMPVGDRVLEGFVDLLVADSEGFIVVDYKTDAVGSEAELDAAVGRYRLQAAGYALLVERATGNPVQRCVLVFLTAGGAVEREVPDLERAVAEVEEALCRP